MPKRHWTPIKPILSVYTLFVRGVEKAKMASENKESSRERSNANLRPFKPGQSGNPGGRPKAYFTEALRKELERDPAVALGIVKAILDKAKTGDVKAFDSLLDRTEGKVPQQHILDGDLSLGPEAHRNRLAELIQSLKERGRR